MFFTLIFAVFLGFTLMVINTALLVYQKIRLQSAVDLASYAGASVQASYLGNQSSGEYSIKAMNNKIEERYFQLLKQMDFGTLVPLPMGFPDPISCAVACQAANLINGDHAVRLYRNAVSDIQDYHDQIRAIKMQLPEAARKAAEQTLALNIPELALESQGGFGSAGSKTTNEVSKIIQSGGSQNIFGDKQNAVLTFTSDKGMYLANAVGPVPHSFVYYGPACFDLLPDPTEQFFYCTANGAGAGGGPSGLAMANLAVLRGKMGGPYSGNIGRIKSIADMGSNAIRLQLVEDVFRPQPSVVVAAEWYPSSAQQANFENPYDEKEGLFPDKVKLVSVSAAEPFGTSLISNYGDPFGVRLQGLRKVLLDPRMDLVKEDYNQVFEYMRSLGPTDKDGEPAETAEETIRRFMH